MSPPPPLLNPWKKQKKIQLQLPPLKTTLTGGIKPLPLPLLACELAPPPVTGVAVTRAAGGKCSSLAFNNLEWGMAACGLSCACYGKLSLKTNSTLHWIHRAVNTEEYTYTHTWPSWAAAPDCPVPHLGLSYLSGPATLLKWQEFSSLAEAPFPTIINVTLNDWGTAPVLHVKWCRQQDQTAGDRCSLMDAL